MRTSKKLLSFFLAVVMVITTCSVGFTAFAKDYDSIWNNSSDAEAAFESLNGLADEFLPSALMGVELIANGIYDKYADDYGKTAEELTDAEKAEIQEKTTLSEILQVLQPTLLGALAGKDAASHASLFGNAHNADYYSYLSGRDDTLDFYTLYQLCRTYRHNVNLSDEDKATLESWYQQLDTIANLDVIDSSQDAVDKLLADFYYESWLLGEMTEYNYASLYILDEVYANWQDGLDAEVVSGIEAKMAQATEDYKNYGAPDDFDIDTFAKYVYYVYGAGTQWKYAYAYSSALTVSEEQVTYTIEPDDEDFIGLGLQVSEPTTVTDVTTDNFIDKYLSAFGYSFDDLVALYVEMFEGEMGGSLTQEQKDDLYAYLDAVYRKDGISVYNDTIVPDNYEALVKGIAIKYSAQGVTAESYDQMIQEKLPENYKTASIEELLSVEDIQKFGSVFFVYNGTAASDIQELGSFFVNSAVTGTDRFGGEINWVLPDAINNNYISEYFGYFINESANVSGTSALAYYRAGLRDAFYTNLTTGDPFFDKEGNPASTQFALNNRDQCMVYEDCNLLVVDYQSGKHNYDVATLDQYIDDAVRYAYGQLSSDLLSDKNITYTRNSRSTLRTDINYKELIDNCVPQPEQAKPVLNEEQLAVLNGDYDLTGDLGTELVNIILNNTLSDIVSNEMLAGIINGLVTTNIDLESALLGIWSRLCDDPIATIFELIPILVVLVDEFLLPLVFNSGVTVEGGEAGIDYDKEAGLLENIGFELEILYILTNLLGMDHMFLADYSYDYNSYVGIDQLGWDLNVLLPNLMHWLLASEEDQKNKNVAGIDYYVDSNTTLPVYYEYEDVENETHEKRLLTYVGTDVAKADFEHYTVQDTNGNVITKDGDSYTYNGATGTIEELLGGSETEFNCYMTYESKVPYITGIYIADKALADAGIYDMPKLLSGIDGISEDVATALGEVITEIAVLFGTAVDIYVSEDEFVSQTRYKNGEKLFSGLNNVFVALPQLFDIMENLAAVKYGIGEDSWTFCYDGKISTSSEGNLAGPSGTASVVNAPLETFKSYAGSDDPNRSVDILDSFVGLVIEDWLNAVVSLINNVIETDNVITQNLPIITGLLRALDGFGENSVFTDIFNGIFQLKRGDNASFEFKLQDNGFTGLSSENAYFLFANVDTLVDVILALVESFKSDSGNSGASGSAVASVASLISAFSNDTAVAAPRSSATASGFTEQELSNVDTLITKLDETVAAVLANSSINDYAVNNTENILSGVVSLLSNYIGSENSEAVVALLDDYLYYLNGAGTRTADANGNVKAEEVYTNDNLTGIVVRTFALLENIVGTLLEDYDYVQGSGEEAKTYNLLASAINGVISPDSIGIRLDDYADAQSDILSLKNWNAAMDENGNVTASIDWNVSAGDKDAFYDGIAASLRLVTSILGVILVDAGIYENALYPVFSTIASYVGFTVDTPEQYADASNPYRDEVLLGFINPIVDFLDAFLAAPITTLIKTVQALAAILDDNGTRAPSIATIVSNTVTPIADELLGLAAIFRVESDMLLPTSPTLAMMIETIVEDNIAPLTYVENNQLVNLLVNELPLCGENLIPIINSYLEATGITLNAIDWKALSEAVSPADALAYFIEYLVETVTNNENLDVILGLFDPNSDGFGTISSLINAIRDGKIDGKGVVNILIKILDITQNPTLFAWSFEKYLQEAIEGFSYPLGLTKAQADEAAQDIDAVINNIFPLLTSLGVDLGGNNISEILASNLFKNEFITQLTVVLYEALSSNADVAKVLGILGIPTSPAEVAALLTDASYGATYSEAAAVIASKASWSELYTTATNENGNEVKTFTSLNWGFTDGAANAQQGFVNALVAVLRPLNNVLGVFLNSGKLELGSELTTLISDITIDATTNEEGTLTYAMANGVLTLTVIDPTKSDSTQSVIKLDFNEAINKLGELAINGTNGYNSAIIPLLEAFQCEGIVSEAQYKADYAAAKDNLLLDILNPIVGAAETSLINKIVASPVVTIATILPTVAAYIDASGLSQTIVNLLAPVANIIYAVNEAVDINELITTLLGQSLNDYITNELGIDASGLNIDFSDLSTLNIEDFVVPLLNMLLADTGIVIPDINWNTLTSLGERTTYTSLATDVDGTPLEGKTVANVDYGKVLITVLRYVLNTVINNIDAIESALTSSVTDETLLAILGNVFTQIKTHSADQIIVAIYYFFVGENTSEYWDYSVYQTKANTFTYPEGVNEAQVANIINFIDGLIDDIDLETIVGEFLYTNDLINTLAQLIYTNIDKVKINDSIPLSDILSIAGITTDKDSVVALLSDSNYGETEQFKAATDAIAAAADWASVDFTTLDWGVTDQESLLKALVAILRPFEGLLDVIIADGKLNLLEGIDIPGSNGYVNSIVPLLEAFRCEGILSYEDYLAQKDEAYDNLLLNILKPILALVDEIIANPVNTLASIIPNLALFIGNEGIIKLVVNLITPISAIIREINPVIDVDKLLQTLLPDVEGISITNLEEFLTPYIGSSNIIPLVNSLLTDTGIVLPEIDWLKLASYGEVKNEASAVECIGQRIVVDGNASQLVVALLMYVLNTVVNNLDAIINLVSANVTDAKVLEVLNLVKTSNITADELFRVVVKVLGVTQNPTLIAWSFEKYLLEAVEGFSYPIGITKAQADEAAQDIDAVINNIFPLLASLGVDLKGNNLNEILNNNLFKNEFLTQLTVILYEALSSNATVAQVLNILGIPTSTAEVASLLMDTSYGATYSEAAAVIASKASWSELYTVTKNEKNEDVKTYVTMNWGFTNGAANAQQGFVNALVAILRPLNDVLAIFLNTGNMEIGNGLYNLLATLNVEPSTSGSATIAVTNGVISISIANEGSEPTAISVDLKKLETLKELLIMGTNGYNSAIIPLLEAFQCGGIVSEAQYKADYAAAKDNLLLDILNPIVGAQSNSLLSKVIASPIVTIATILPTVAMYLDAHGLSQTIVNLLAPVANIIYTVNDVIDINALIKILLGQSLGDFVAGKIGMAAGSVTIDFSDLSTLNVEDMVIPLVNSLVKSYNLTFANINWNALISLGERTTYTSLATDVNGVPLTGKTLVNVDYGKVLITVLRYVGNALITNADALNTLIQNIETNEQTKAKVKDNATIVAILNNVFTQIKTHTADQIIVALYYFFVGDNTQAYWDYSNYKTKASTFKYPDGVTADNVAALVAFLDGVIEEIDLNTILNQYLYTDSIINQLAKALYVNLNNVKLSDSLMLGSVLSIAGINVDKASVVSMLSDSRYGETAQFKSATDAIAAAANWAAVDFNSLSWGVKDQDTFVKALVAVLRPFIGILDVLLADGKLNLLEGIDIPGSNGYVNSIVPLLEALTCKDIKSYETYLADKNKTYDSILLDVLEPLLGLINDIVANPIETIASALPNIALFIGNEGIIQLVVNLITPITAIVKDVNPLIDVDMLLQSLLGNKVANISITNLDKFLEPYVGSANLVNTINSLLGSIKALKDKNVKLVLPNIDWLALASLGTVQNATSAVQCIGQRIVVDADTSKVVTAFLQYVLGAVLSNKDAIITLAGNAYTGTLKTVLDLIFSLDADALLKLVFSIVDLTQSPTEVFWSYKKYVTKYKASFKYPNGITAEDAENAVAQLDNAVAGVFALLEGMDVIDAGNLNGVLNDALFTNEMLTRLAVDLYGALDASDAAQYLNMLGIATSTKDIAKILTDKSYGKTYSAAAKAIKSKSSWSKLKTTKKNDDGSTSTTYASINWGFTNGAANAQQGFVNALTAIFRPFVDILGPFLTGSDLALGEMLYGLIVGLNVNSGDQSKGETLVTLKKGVLTVQTQSNGVYSTAIELDLGNIVSLKQLNLYGSNGYENSIIPLFDVLQIDNSEIKTFDQYVKDAKKAKDNILLNILNPLMSFINKVCDAPFDTITSVLPNLAYFIDNNGIGQLLDNLLSPVTQILKDAKKDGIDIDKIIKTIAGKDLSTLLLDLMKVDGVKFNLKLTNLAACDIHEILVPLLNQLLKKTGIRIPDFAWSTIASHGDITTSKSKAENSQGKFTNKEVIADKGETLVAVLRYVANVLIQNAKSLKSLLGGIDAIKNNDTIKSVINSVFNTIGASDDDAIVLAVFYFLIGTPTNAFWDYTAYETGEYDFSYPEGIDVDFLVNLPPMLDGLIGGLLEGGLNAVISDALFTDDIISSLATGLYGAIDGVKINDSTTLTQLLAMTDIDFSTENVAKLLVDEAYGQAYPGPAAVISAAGSWANVDAASLNWGVTDRDSFFHALVAVLRPIYGVLDVLLNDAYLGLFDIVRIPGSNGYTSSIIPLMEAFSMYNIKTQYEYRQDIIDEYDNILLDIINPLWDKIEDLLNAPLQTLAAMVPNLALFIGNNGLCQIIDNLLTPVSALIDAIKPVVDLNDLLSTVLGALGVDLGATLAKIGVTNFSLDLYDLNAMLKSILGADAIIPLINSILGMIEIGGQPLGLKLNDVDWLQLASHGETYVGASQAATYGSRIYVEGDPSETLIAVLRYLVDTINTGDNYDKINELISGLLGDGVDDSVSDIIGQVLGALKGETDEVLAALVDLLSILA